MANNAAPARRAVQFSNRFLSRLMAYQSDFEGWGELDALI